MPVTYRMSLVVRQPEFFSSKTIPKSRYIYKMDLDFRDYFPLKIPSVSKFQMNDNRELNYFRMNYRFEKNHTFPLYEFQVASHL